MFCIARRRRQAPSAGKKDYSIERDNPAYGVVPTGTAVMDDTRGVINNDLYQGVAVGGMGAIANDAYVATSMQEPMYADAPVLTSSHGPAVNNATYAPRAGWPPGPASEHAYSVVVPRADRVPAATGVLLNPTYKRVPPDGNSTAAGAAPAARPPIAPRRQPATDAAAADDTYNNEAVVSHSPPKAQYSVPVIFGGAGTMTSSSGLSDHSASTGHYAATAPAYITLDDDDNDDAEPIYNEAVSAEEGEYVPSPGATPASSVRAPGLSKVTPTPKPRISLAERRSGGTLPQPLSLLPKTTGETTSGAAAAPFAVSPGRHFDEDPIPLSPTSPPGSATSRTSRASLV
jgi:hypothetical protein